MHFLISILSIILLLAGGCTTVDINNTKPPFADPNSNVPYAKVTAAKNTAGTYVELTTADGKYAARILGEGHNVSQMHLTPGKHRLNVWCFKGSMATTLGIDILVDLEPTEYVLSCKSSEDGLRGIFSLTRESTNESIPFEYLRTTDSSGTRERKNN